MRVKVVIPYYKNKTQLEACRASLKGQIDDQGVVVVDDSEASRGFVWACNEGLRPLLKDGTEYAIVLNQDCYLKEGAIDKMTKFMDEHPKCAIGGIKHFAPDDDDVITHGGCTVAFPTGIHLVGKVSKGDHAVSKRMPWVNGACLIVRINALYDTGLMDNNFDLIGSDSDWCYTARDRGWEVWYIAEAECVHDHGLSRSAGDKFLDDRKYKDIIRFRDKWLTDVTYRELSLEIF